VQKISHTTDRPLLPAQHETVPATPASSAATPPSLSAPLHAAASHGAVALSQSVTEHLSVICRLKLH